ncbi:MAG: tetratricopeptide repeat protein [Rhizobiaceae bacterium]|nr:tetratricopeptide repeat protein [Rhizobiaceae bacterium]
MSDDSFIREVNEEMRRAQAKALWDRYGPIGIALALAVILGTAAWVAWDYWTASRANRSGDAFSQALSLATDGKPDEALAAFNELEKGGYGAYPILARMRAATVLLDKGDFQGAVSAFDAVTADASVPEVLRDMAKLRSGFIMVDHGSYDDVASRLEPMTADTHPLRFSAREAIGLSAWKAGNATEALRLFELIENDQAAPRNARERATMMADLIRGAGSGS